MAHIVWLSICSKNKMNLLKNHKIIRYVFSGVVTSLSVFVLLYLLVQVLNIWYLLASVISFCFGVIVSFSFQKFFTFKDHKTKGLHRQFSFFFLLNLCMLGVNTLLMYIFVDLFGFWYLSSQICITIFTACINYISFNRLIFKDN